MNKLIKTIIAFLMITALLTGCTGTYDTGAANTEAPAVEAADTQAAEAEPAEAEAEPAETTEAEAPAEEPADAEAPAAEDAGSVEVRVGSLKGPTSMGVIRMIHEQGNNNYRYTIETQADTLLSSIVSGDLDIALIPANVSSVLYNKTKGGISVIDINTLGVLYMVSGDKNIKEIKDLEGHTVYTTGAGSTPEFVLRYLLEENGLTDKVKIEFKSEATEVAALLSEDPSAVGMLPQPFVIAAISQNDSLSMVLDMTKEWDALNNGSMLITGVTVVRNDFLSEHPEAVEQFLKDHASDVEFVNSDAKTASEYVAEAGIIEKAPVAEKAIPLCNIVCITGNDMKTALSGYLKVLFDQDPSSVGGTLPADDYYFVNE